MNQQIRNGTQSGMVFGIVIIFLFLIGFTSTVSDLLGGLLRDQGAKALGLTADMVNLMVFLGLLGLWAGSRGAKPIGTGGGILEALLGGASAGLTNGVLVGACAYLVGLLNAFHVKISTYLALVLPDSINLFLFGKGPLGGAALEFGLLFLTGILGGILSFGLRGNWRKKVQSWWSPIWTDFQNRSGMLKLRRFPWFMPAVYLVILIFVFILPLVIGKYWNYTLGTVGIYVLLGLGLNIVVGLAGLLDLGYVAFFAIGAYTVALLTAPQPHHLLWNFWITLPLGILLAGSAGVLLGIPVLRMRGDYLAIVTLGFGEIIRILLTSDVMTPFSGGPKGVNNIGAPTLFGKPFSSDIDFVYLILLGVLLVILVTSRLRNSRVGRAWEAMREDETVARAMGINTLGYKLLAFAIGAAFAGLGGVLFASRNQFTGPEDHNLMVSINVLCVVIVGGMGSIPGVIAGAFVLKGLPEVLRDLQNYRIVAFGALLVAMMIMRPAGLFPSSRRSLELKKPEEPVPTEPESSGGRFK